MRGLANARRALFLTLFLTAATGSLAQSGRSQLDDLSRAFREVYEKAAPAAVLIRTTPGQSALRRALPQFHPPLPDDDGDRFSWLGSGTVVSEDGLVLSNYHVIAGADSISVVLSDRRAFPAEVVGSDSLIDIAVLKIEARDLPVVSFADVDKLQIGDWVLAIGHPLGLGSTLTHGIVSALGREAEVIRSDYAIESFIQTNAVINPGNSGGPLLNLRGEVVGINTAISTRTGYYIGYGLAVPIDLVQEAMRDILRHGRTIRGFMGIDMREVDQALAERVGLSMPVPTGVYVSRVIDETPAAAAGMLYGDVVLAVDDQEVNLRNQVQTLIYARDPGEVVRLTVLRDGDTLSIPVTLGEPERERFLAEGKRRLSRLGLVVTALSPSRAEDLGFTPDIAGQLGFVEGQEPVAVVQVDSAGIAAAKGIELFDIITEIDRERIASSEDMMRQVSQLEVGKSALFWLWRRGRGVDVRALKIQEE